MDLVGHVGAKERRAQRVAPCVPAAAHLIGERVLRPQNLELRGEELIVLVDLLRVDEAKAAVSACKH